MIAKNKSVKNLVLVSELEVNSLWRVQVSVYIVRHAFSYLDMLIS